MATCLTLDIDVVLVNWIGDSLCIIFCRRLSHTVHKGSVYSGPGVVVLLGYKSIPWLWPWGNDHLWLSLTWLLPHLLHVETPQLSEIDLFSVLVRILVFDNYSQVNFIGSFLFFFLKYLELWILIWAEKIRNTVWYWTWRILRIIKPEICSYLFYLYTWGRFCLQSIGWFDTFEIRNFTWRAWSKLLSKSGFL